MVRGGREAGAGTLSRHGPHPFALRRGLSRRASRLAGRESPWRGTLRRGRGLRPPPRLAEGALRCRLRRVLVAQGVRRPRRDHDRAGPVRRGDGARQGARAGQHPGDGHGRAGGDHPRQRRAEGALAASHPHRRGDLVPGVLGARIRLRPGFAQDQGGQVQRRVGGDRPEGVDDLRPQGQVVHAGGAHGLRRAQAPGAHLLHLGHGAGSGSGASAAPDHQPAGVQRALHRGGADTGRERRRRRGQRLGRGHHHAHERARRAGRLGGRRGQDGSRGAQGAGPRARRRRRPGDPPEAGPAHDRGGAAAPQLLARPHDDHEARRARPRGLAAQVAVGRDQPGTHRGRGRDPWRGGDLLGLALDLPPAALARELDRGRHHRDPQEHHRRARARPSRNCARKPT